MSTTDHSSPSSPPPHFVFDVKPFPSEPEKPTQRSGLFFFQLSTAEAVTELRSLLSLSLPTALTSLLLYSRAALSLLFLGSLGSLPLAAGSLALATANISGYSVLQGLALGAEPLCSQAAGAQRPDLLALALHRSIIFLLSAALPLAFLWLQLSRPLLILLGQDPEIVALAATYLRYSVIDLFSFAFIHPIRIYLRSQGITFPITAAAAGAAVVHVPVSLLLVSKLHLGVPGVAAASAVSNLTLLLFLATYVVIRPTRHHRPTLECLRPSGFASLARLAGPSCAGVCLEWWWYELVTLLCGLLPNPKPAVAATGILMQTTALLYIPPSSLSLATSARVGNALGAGQPASARAAAFVSIAAAAASGLATAAVAFFFATGDGRWGRLFTSDQQVLWLTSAVLPIVGLCELGNCPQTTGCGVLRGSAQTGVAATASIGAFYGVGMPVAVGLGFGFGLGFPGLWMGLLAAQVFCAGMMVYAVGSTDWEAQARLAQKVIRPDGGFVSRCDEDELQQLIPISSKGKDSLLAN